MDGLFSRYRAAAGMDFGAYAYVGASVQDPGKYCRKNVAGTVTLLEAVRDCSIQHFIFSSTCATYGVPERVSIGEDCPQVPINPYGAAKVMIKRLVADFERAHGLRYFALRYFNAAEADPDWDIGEDYDPEAYLIPLSILAAQRGAPELAICGTGYPDRRRVRRS